MAPAFSSPRQAAVFALLLLVTLLSPILVSKSVLPPREQIYDSISWNSGDYPFIHQQIFEEKGDIDIAFMGSSHMYKDIDTLYVQKKLSEKLGHPATVISLCWRWSGIDNLYFIAQDLLRNRKVQMLVLYDDQGTDHPHSHAWQLIRVGDNWKDIEGLPLGNRLAYYYGAVLGVPRNLIGLFWSNLPPDLKPEMIQFLQWRGDGGAFNKLPTDNLGAESARANYDDLGPFVPYTPQSPAKPSDVCIYSTATQDQFAFGAWPAAPLQTYFAEKLKVLAQSHGTKLVCLNLPMFDDRRASKIPEGRLWRDTLHSDSSLVGIPPQKLFAGLDDESVRRLFHDSGHLNDNGQRYFTRLITPTLLQLYEPANP